MFQRNERYNLPNKIAGGIIKSTMTRCQARTALHEAGWDYIGGGSYSSVWRSPDKTRVVKVSKPDNGAEAICEAYCRDPDNPVFPKYFGRRTLAERGYVYEIEALTELDHDQYRAVRAIGAELINSEQFPKVTGYNPDDCNYPASTARAFGFLSALVDELGEGRLDWDCHSGNMLMRYDACVLIDPLYQPATLKKAWRGTKGNEVSNGDLIPISA
ncbi:MAG: hypothetical protein AAGF48_14915 [Pseudomonadota bacterium]